MTQIQLGVVGCGVMGPQHIQSALDSGMFRVVAVADTLESRALEVAQCFAIPKTYSDAHALIDDPQVQAVVLAVAAGVRFPLAVHALKRGKHVLLEKPAAIDSAQLRELIRLRGNLVVGSCSSRYRFLRSAQAVTDFLATGALGQLRELLSRVILPPGPLPASPPPAWRVSKALNGGGIMVNLGIYDLDFMMGITGWTLQPEHVLARTWTVPPQFASYVAEGSDAEEHFASFITCRGGTVLSFERGERVAAPAEEVYKITGTRGSLHLQMQPSTGKKIVFTDSSLERGVFEEIIWQGDEDRLPLRTGVIEDFGQAILQGRQPATDLDKALLLQTITDAIYASADQGRPVSVES